MVLISESFACCYHTAYSNIVCFVDLEEDIGYRVILDIYAPLAMKACYASFHEQDKDAEEVKCLEKFNISLTTALQKINEVISSYTGRLA